MPVFGSLWFGEDVCIVIQLVQFSSVIHLHVFSMLRIFNLFFMVVMIVC